MIRFDVMLFTGCEWGRLQEDAPGSLMQDFLHVWTNKELAIHRKEIARVRLRRRCDRKV